MQFRIFPKAILKKLFEKLFKNRLIYPLSDIWIHVICGYSDTWNSV